MAYSRETRFCLHTLRATAINITDNRVGVVEDKKTRSQQKPYLGSGDAVGFADRRNAQLRWRNARPPDPPAGGTQ